jgi:hypothetical protein
MQITIKGLTGGIRTASGTTRGLGASMGFLSATTGMTTKTQNALNVSTVKGVITEKAFYTQIANTTTNQHLKALATQRAAQAAVGATVANQGLAFSELVAAVNAKILGRALMSMIPIV